MYYVKETPRGFTVNCKQLKKTKSFPQKWDVRHASYRDGGYTLGWSARVPRD